MDHSLYIIIRIRSFMSERDDKIIFHIALRVPWYVATQRIILKAVLYHNIVCKVNSPRASDNVLLRLAVFYHIIIIKNTELI